MENVDLYSSIGGMDYSPGHCEQENKKYKYDFVGTKIQAVLDRGKRKMIGVIEKQVKCSINEQHIARKELKVMGEFVQEYFRMIIKSFVEN